jgi:hypothetical protein
MLIFSPEIAMVSVKSRPMGTEAPASLRAAGLKQPSAAGEAARKKPGDE